MLVPSLALTSINQQPYWSAILFPSSGFTFRSYSRSHLAPTRNFTILLGECSLICLTQDSTLPKDYLLTIEQVKITARAPLKQVWLTFLNLSWPAVSHSCNLIFLSCTSMFLFLKSTPTVETRLGLYSLLQKRQRMLVLPTPLSPTMIILAEQSTGSSFVFLIPIYYNLPTYQQSKCIAFNRQSFLFIVMKGSVDIQRLPIKVGSSQTNDMIAERRAIIQQLNETRKNRLDDIRKQLQNRELQPCIGQEEIYVEGHSIEKPKGNSRSRIKSKQPYIAKPMPEKNIGVGDIEKMTFDKKFKNYLNHKQEFLEKAKRRQEVIRDQRRKLKQGENDVDDYYNEEEILSNTGSDYQYKNAEDMGDAYENLATGKRKKKGGVQLFYAQKFQFAFRLLEFESLMGLMQDPSQALISKDLLLNYLFEEPMIMMLYSINPYQVADEIAEFQTEVPSMLCFQQFSGFLLIDREPTYFEYTEQNLNQARQIGRGLKCAPIVGKWIDESGIYEDLIDIFNSVDMFGSNKADRSVLAKKLALQCEKKRIMDVEVVEIVNINKLVPLSRLVYEIEHEIGGNEMVQRHQFEEFLLHYHRLPTPEKDKLITKLIMAGKYDTSYIYVVSSEVLEFLKSVFKEMEKFAQYFVKKEKFIEKVIKNKKYQKLRGYLVRSEGNRYVLKQTVQQALQRLFNEADNYIDLEDILDFFTNRGRPRVIEYHVYLANLERQIKIIEEEEQARRRKIQQTGEEPSTSSDEQFQKQLKRRQIARKHQKLAQIHKNLKYDYKKKFNVTIPVTFGFQTREKKLSIRESKLKQMLEQKRLQQEESLKPIPIKQVPKHVKEPLYEKMLKDQQRQRKERLQRFKLEIQNSMVPMPERLTKRHVPEIHCDFARQPYQFVARPMPWYCEVNLLERINRQKQERRQKILEQIINRHHDNDLPEGVIRMLERHEQIQQKRQMNKTASTSNAGECTFIPSISHYIPDFKAIHDKLNIDMEIAKENRELVHPEPFSFETRDKKSKSHMSHQHCVPRPIQKLSQSRGEYRPPENKEVEIKPTLKFIGLVEKRKSEREAKKKEQEEVQQKNQIRKLRQQKFAPQVRRILQKNENQMGRSRKQMLDKLKQFQRQEKKKVRQYENKMIDIYTKVWNRPLLIEGNEYGQQDIKKNPRLNDDEQGQETIKKEGPRQGTVRDQKESRRRQMNEDYEEKRRRAIEQPPGQYLIQQDSQELQNGAHVNQKGRVHSGGHQMHYYEDEDGDEYGDEDEQLEDEGLHPHGHS